MKKLFFILATLFSMTTYADALVEGKQYVQVSNSQATSSAEVIEFFSFYCPHCYSFEYQYQIPTKVKNSLPQGVEFKQYHVNFLGRQSENLTRAWAFAMATGNTDKVKEDLFNAAQKDKLRSMNDIREIFIKHGISAEQFDSGINSFVVNALVNKQINLAEQMKVRSVPDFYVNQRFRVNPEGLNQQDFIQDYVQTIKGLLQK